MNELSEIKAKAIEYLARREHSKHELTQKLLLKFPHALAAIQQAIEELSAKNLQSDERYIEVCIRHKAASGYGWLRIKQELAQHNLDSDLVREVHDRLEIDWQEIAVSLYKKKYANKPITNSNEKLKRSRYLFSHGFSYELIKSVISYSETNYSDGQ